jgi:hypothetical protein
MTKLLPYSRHPSTPLRMTIFAALTNPLMGQPLLLRPVFDKSAHENPPEAGRPQLPKFCIL